MNNRFNNWNGITPQRFNAKATNLAKIIGIDNLFQALMTRIAE